MIESTPHIGGRLGPYQVTQSIGISYKTPALVVQCFLPPFLPLYRYKLLSTIPRERLAGEVKCLVWGVKTPCSL